ncbi:MAG: hypothetical protein JSW20_09760 [Nitrospiraceae bacterium]|nr:MAG: hypothetical protein JSW20_09760 [Nitrospiraceae bacterium]
MNIFEVLSKRYLRNFFLCIGITFVIGTSISAAVLYSDIYQPLNTHYGAILSIIGGLKESLTAKTLKINVIFYILISTGIGLLSVLYSHRVAGPLHRIKIFLRSIADGTPEKILQLRHKDAIDTFASTINEMTDAYRRRNHELKSEIDQLRKSAHELEQLAEEGRPVDKVLEEIIDTDRRISGLLKAIKINEE